MLRAISVAWQRMQGDVRVIKVTGAPRVSYWELKTLNGNSLGISPSNVLGILTFDTSFSAPANLFPVTLGGTGYREGVLLADAPIGSGGGPSYSATPPATLSGLINVSSDSFTITSSGITTPTTITLSSNLAGTFSQPSITLPIGSATQTFTYTPTVVGNHVISFSSTLADPSPINYVSTPPPPTYSVTPPGTLSGLTNTPSGAFTVISNDITTPTTITLSSNLAGTFSQSSITLPIGSSTQTFTYTPTVVGNHVISFSSTLTNPSPINYVSNPPPPAYSVTPPATLSGLTNSPSGSFTITSSNITTPISVTLSSNLGGTFSQSVVTLPVGSATQTFTYTPTTAGNHVISFSSTLTNPSPINYSASAPSPSYSVTSPGTLSGLINVASGSFTITSSNITTPTTVTLSSNLTGTFSQTVVNLPIGSSTQTFTYTPTTAGTHTISFSSPLANPSPINYNALRYSVTPPAALSGPINVASGAFTVTSSGLSTPRVVTLSSNLSGTFSPSTITLPTLPATQTFTYTPTTAGNHVISFSSSLVNPSPITYVAT